MKIRQLRSKISSKLIRSTWYIFASCVGYFDTCHPSYIPGAAVFSTPLIELLNFDTSTLPVGGWGI